MKKAIPPPTVLVVGCAMNAVTWNNVGVDQLRCLETRVNAPGLLSFSARYSTLSRRSSWREGHCTF